MRYQKISPSPRLQKYVRGYYTLEHMPDLNAPFEIKSSANPTYALVFNYGDRYRLFNHTVSGETLPTCFLSGISLSNYTLKFDGSVGCCGILLQGTAFQNLFPTPPTEEILNRRIDLRLILGEKATEVSEQIMAADSDQKRVAILENLMLSFVENTNHPLNPIDLAANKIIRERGMLSMDRLADEVCMSPRQLRRKFKTQVGVGPKTYARLKRFNYVTNCLSRDSCLSWKEFVNAGGFYDQSHFIKEFVEFSGENPSGFIHRSRALRKKLQY